MTSESTVPPAHKAVLALARSLEKDERIDPRAIADALLVIGVNAGVRLIGAKGMANWLEKTAKDVRAGATVKSFAALERDRNTLGDGADRFGDTRLRYISESAA